MGKSKTRTLFNAVVYLAKFIIKAVLFFAVVLAIINEYLIFSDLTEFDAAVYTRLSDLNRYLAAVGITLSASFAFFAFGLSHNKPLLLSVDLLLSLLVLFYVLLNYKPWVEIIPSDVEGYTYLLSNIRFVFYAIWAAMSLVYISIISFKTVYIYFFGVEAIHESSHETFMKQMQDHKHQKLTELQMTATELEGGRLSTQEYHSGIKQLYLDKVRLHESY